jgi:hypothetical protein
LEFDGLVTVSVLELFVELIKEMQIAPSVLKKLGELSIAKMRHLA